MVHAVHAARNSTNHGRPVSPAEIAGPPRRIPGTRLSTNSCLTSLAHTVTLHGLKILHPQLCCVGSINVRLVYEIRLIESLVVPNKGLN